MITGSVKHIIMSVDLIRINITSDNESEDDDDFMDSDNDHILYLLRSLFCQSLMFLIFLS